METPFQDNIEENFQSTEDTLKLGRNVKINKTIYESKVRRNKPRLFFSDMVNALLQMSSLQMFPFRQKGKNTSEVKLKLDSNRLKAQS